MEIKLISNENKYIDVLGFLLIYNINEESSLQLQTKHL